MDVNFTFANGFDLPPFFSRDRVVIVAYDKNRKTTQATAADSNQVQPQHQYPLTFKASGLQDFTFPIDPIIGLGMKNIIVRRSVAKGEKRGTVKERWTEDDVDITISGVFISEDGSYPQEVNRLKEFFKQRKAIDVECSLLNERDIFQIAIEGLDLPFTKGPGNQAFEIKAYSDDVFTLLIEE